MTIGPDHPDVGVRFSTILISCAWVGCLAAIAVIAGSFEARPIMRNQSVFALISIPGCGLPFGLAAWPFVAHLRSLHRSVVLLLPHFALTCLATTAVALLIDDRFGILLAFFAGYLTLAGDTIIRALARENTDDDAGPHCPRCRYRLRGLAGDRCPECGWERDDAADPQRAQDSPAR